MTQTTPKYDSLGKSYAIGRRPDPRLAAAIRGALGDAKSLLNVGAGTGSYEPGDLDVMALEPSQVMIDQRAADAAPVTKGVAEDLPFDDNAFDAAQAILTLHHWADWEKGIAELKRVARKRVVLFTFDPEYSGDFWLVRDYLPEGDALDRRQFPSIKELLGALGGGTVTPFAIPDDCIDGFLCAYWKRPEAYLNPKLCLGSSTFSQVEAGAVNRALDKLAADLESGEWRKTNANILDKSGLDLGYRIIVKTL